MRSVNGTRRSLLRLASATGIVGMLPGCATIGDFKKALDFESIEHGTPAKMGPEEIANANEAAAFFDHFNKTKTLPMWSTSPVITSVALRDALTQWNRTKTKYQNAQQLNLEQGQELVDGILPALRLVDQIKAESTGVKMVRRMPSGKASLKGTEIIIPPGGMVHFTQKGYCMDPSLPAPSKGEKFQLVSTARLIPKRLQPLYKGILQKGKTDRRYNAENMQLLIWALRGAGTRSMFAEHVSPNLLALMADAAPGGDKQFQAYHQQELALANLKGSLAGLLNLNVNGKQFNALDLLDPKTSAKVANDLVAELSRRPIAGAIPNDNSMFTMLEPGVAAMTLGDATLTPAIVVANATDANYVLDLSKLAAQSQRATQRVALMPPNDLYGAQYPVAAVARPGDGLQTPASDSEKKSFVESALKDLGKFFAEKTLPELNKFPSVRNWMAAGAKSRFVKELLTSTPLLGNVLSLYEATTGKDWLTMEDLSPAERLLAVAGTIPGGGTLAKVAGSSTLRLVRAAANSPTVWKLAHAAEKTELARDIAQWMLTDSVQQAGDAVMNTSLGKTMRSVYQDAVMTLAT